MANTDKDSNHINEDVAKSILARAPGVVANGASLGFAIGSGASWVGLALGVPLACVPLALVGGVLGGYIAWKNIALIKPYKKKE